jgi:glycosyltransferase involved in cell wall biosynthesis
VGTQWLPMERDRALALTRSLDLPARFVLAVGTSAPRKNLARLTAAVESLRTGTPALSGLGLVLAGPADASSDNGARWVRQLGFVEDERLRALYSVADAVAYVSLYEGFGLPVLEALACGAVVVASETTATVEAAGEACVTVDPWEVSSIAAGLRTALEDEALRAELRSRAPAHVARFSWDDCAEQMMAVYRAALAR